MDRYTASILRRIVDKHGPVTTILALTIVYRRSLTGLIGSAGALLVAARLIGAL
jgi:hypothetical protein